MSTKISLRQALLVSFSTVVALGVDPSMAAAPDTSADQGTKVEEVVVTGHYEFLSADTSGATNLPLPIEKVPQSISLVSADFIKAADLKTLGEIAEYTPGAINGGNQENFGSIIKLRGFSAGTSLDGLSLLGGFGFFEPDKAIFDRLEIVKGPSSVVYGISSPGGQLNFVTKSATRETPDYVSIQGGNWDNYRFEGQFAGALDTEGHVRAIGIAVYDRGDSFVDQLYHKNISLYGGLNFNLGGAVTAYLHGGYERQDMTSFDGIPTEPDGTPAPLPRSFFIGSPNAVETTNAYYADGDLTWHATDMFDLSIKGTYEKARTAGAETFANGNIAPNGDLSIGAATFSGDGLLTENYAVGPSGIYHFDGLGLKNSFVSVAALYQSSNATQDDAFANSATVNVFGGEPAINQGFDAILAGPLFPFSQVVKTDVFTVSAQSVLQVIDPLNLLLGVSYSKPDTKIIAGGSPPQDFSFKGQMSYRAGLTYEMLPGAIGYLSFSQSFVPQPVNISIQAIAPPAIGTQYEAGVKYRAAGGRLLLTGAVFQIKNNNVAQFLTNTPQGLIIDTTVGQLTHKGLELQALGYITPQWQINAGYAYLDPKVTADLDPSHVGKIELFQPKQTFDLFTTYSLQNRMVRGLTFGAGARYIASERTSYFGSTKDVPSYTLVDASLSYSIDKWLVQLNARNIFDRRYFINNYQTLIFGNQPGTPANFALTVRRTF
jgi:iron complex outermembrane receptor protein